MKLRFLALSVFVLSVGLMPLNSVQAAAKTEEQTEPDVRTYTIEKVAAAPDWSQIAELSANTILWEPDCGIRAYAQLCFDDSYLYVHLRAVEKDIRAEFTAPLSPVNQDSCLEFFFMPESGDRYFNFEINPNGCLHVEFGHDRSDRFSLYRSNMAELFDIRADRTHDGWEVYYRIPIDFIRLYYPDFEFKGALMANIYKCGDLTTRKHYLSWNPVRSEKPDFHRPEDFGKMYFTN